MSEKDEFTWESLADPNFDSTEYFEQNFPEDYFFIRPTGRKDKVKPVELKDINDNNWTNDSAYLKQQAEDKQKTKKKPKNTIEQTNENKENPEKKKKNMTGRKNKKTKKTKEAQKKSAYHRKFQKKYSTLPPNWFEYLKELMSDFTGRDDENFWLWERELYLLRDTYDLDDRTMKPLIRSKLKLSALDWYKSDPVLAQMPLEDFLTSMARFYDRRSSKLPLWKKPKKQRWCKSIVYNLCLHEKFIPASHNEPDPHEFIPLKTRAAKHENVPPHMLTYYYIMDRETEVLNRSCRRFYKPKQPQKFKIFNELDPFVHFPRMKKQLIKRSPLRQGFEGDKPRKSRQRRKGAGRNKRPRGCKLKVNIFRKRLVIDTILGQPSIGRKVLFVRCMHFTLQRC